MCGTGRTRRSSETRRREGRGTGLLLLLLLAGALFAASPAKPAGAQESPAVALVRELNAAWNAGDPDAVAALFAEDAEVLQADAEVTTFGPDAEIRDVYGVSGSLTEHPRMAGDAAVWAATREEVRRWAAGLLASGHRVEATAYQATAEGASWDYRVPVAWLPGLPGSATQGRAEAVVRDGLIARLSLTSTPDSVRRREAAVAQAVARPRPPAEVGAADAAPGPPDTQTRSTPSPAAWLVAAAVTLSVTAGLACSRRPRW